MRYTEQKCCADLFFTSQLNMCVYLMRVKIEIDKVLKQVPSFGVCVLLCSSPYWNQGRSAQESPLYGTSGIQSCISFYFRIQETGRKPRSSKQISTELSPYGFHTVHQGICECWYHCVLQCKNGNNLKQMCCQCMFLQMDDLGKSILKNRTQLNENLNAKQRMQKFIK